MSVLCVNVNTKLQAVLTTSFPVRNAENDSGNMTTIIEVLRVFRKTLVGKGCKTWLDDSLIRHSAEYSTYMYI